MKYTILTCLGDIVETTNVSNYGHGKCYTTEVCRVGETLFRINSPRDTWPIGLVYPTPCAILQGKAK